jgi:hypothetical protein
MWREKRRTLEDEKEQVGEKRGNYQGRGKKRMG